MDKSPLRRSLSVVLASCVLTVVASAAPPQVVCVPWHGEDLSLPHETWSGRQITLKGTAQDPDGRQPATYEWDFGDGSPPVSGSVLYPNWIEAKHTYVGMIGDRFVARLTVTDNQGESGADDYTVEIKDENDPSVRVHVAIDEGLWYLHKRQLRGTFPDGVPYGYWNPGSMTLSAGNTAAVTEAFEVHGSLPDGDPNENPYVETVQRGLNFLLANTQVHVIPPEPYGDPDTNGNGIGLGSYTDNGRPAYESGLTLMAFARSGASGRVADAGDATWVRGRTYGEIVQDMVDYLAWAQNEDGLARGGWGYGGNDATSDNSCSEWAVTAMGAAEAYLGATVPPFVRDELQVWVGATQNPDGGFMYSNCCNSTWQCSNVPKTGVGLSMMAFLGIPEDDGRVQDALSYLDVHWTDNDGCMGVWDYHFGSRGNYYAFHAVMKGMTSFRPAIEMAGARDWYADYADFITAAQESSGGWIALIGQHNPYQGTAWALLTLRKTVVVPGPVADAGPDVASAPPLIEVVFDASGSYHEDPNKEIVEYCWDFDASDGVDWDEPDLCSTEPTASHAFPAAYNPDGSIDWAGTAKVYTVTLLVKNNGERPMADTDECLVAITAPSSVPVASAAVPAEAFPCETVLLDASGSHDPNGELYPDPSHPWHGTIVSWEWDLDDDGEYNDASGVQVEWSSCLKGTHIIGLRVTNNFGESGSTEAALVVVNRPPVAEANGPYDCQGGEVVFDGSGSHDPDPGETESLEYRWDFESDGVFDTDWSANPRVTRAYSTCEDHTATLEVRDPDGATDTDVAIVDPATVLAVAVDIKPGSCTNPLAVSPGLDTKGVVSVAVLGSDGLDARTIRPETVTLEGVPPLRWSLEDVGTPAGDGNGEDCACHQPGRDGHVDLVLKFPRSGLEEMLHDDPPGDLPGGILPIAGTTVPLTLTGETLDGVPIEGRDCVKIILRGDANGNGRLDYWDAVITVKALRRGRRCPVPLEVLDVDGDGRLDVRDVAHLLRDLLSRGRGFGR